MTRILFEGYGVPPSVDGSAQLYYTCLYHYTFYAIGDTPEEVQADALRQAAKFGMKEPMATGLHNRKADWEAVYGPVDPAKGYHFMDTLPPRRPDPDPPPLTGWQRLWRRLMGRRS